MNGPDDSIVFHGHESHRGSEIWKCEDCQEIQKEFKALVDSGEFEKMLKEYELI